jgi:hypothetical protein
VNDRDYGELTYTFDDVVATLNQVQPYDWAGYLHRRSQRRERPAARGHQPGRLQAGLHRRADRLVQGRREKSGKAVDLTYSGGFVVGTKDGKVTACCGTARRSTPASPSARRSSR